ncbi:hypothetical protein CQW23_24234 [Capsicum baccatum]|uniref:Uncharacterized protein n=1 Tax=Capsicum baccatum TaxID=33114 RepID=A0A2G2VU90_CAPBA|nr:hypothetical protein CQW23_24234 [Capsicum baccatum]
MLQLGSILHSQGFSVKAAHTEHNAPNYSNHPEFVFHSMDDGLQGIDLSSLSLRNMYGSNENCKASFKNYNIRMMEEEEDLQGDQLTCIIYENIMFYGDNGATQLRLSSIVLCVLSATYMHSMITILKQPEKYFPFEVYKMSFELITLRFYHGGDLNMGKVGEPEVAPFLEFVSDGEWHVEGTNGVSFNKDTENDIESVDKASKNSEDAPPFDQPIAHTSFPPTDQPTTYVSSSIAAAPSSYIVAPTISIAAPTNSTTAPFQSVVDSDVESIDGGIEIGNNMDEYVDEELRGFRK